MIKEASDPIQSKILRRGFQTTQDEPYCRISPISLDIPFENIIQEIIKKFGEVKESKVF